MIKWIMYAVLVSGFIYVGATVQLGKHTLFEHVRAIWHTEEVQELKTGVEDKAKPAVDKLKRGGVAAYNAIKGGDREPTGSGSDVGSDAGSDAASPEGHAGSGSAGRPHRKR